MKKIVVIIPDYIRQVKLSEKRKAVYYRFFADEGLCKTKGNPRSNKMPFKYVDPKYLFRAQTFEVVLPWMLKPEYDLGVFVHGKVNRIVPREEYNHNCLDLEKRVAKNERELAQLKLIVVKDGEPVIANPKVVGTPKYQTIRGQDFYSSNIRHARVPLMQAIKQQFLPYVKNIPFIDYAPIVAKMTVFDTIFNNIGNGGEQPWDIGNRSYPYMKAMLDLLSTGHIGDNVRVIEPKLYDDDRLNVSGEFCVFHPVDGEPQLVDDGLNKPTKARAWLQFEFIQDTRSIAEDLRQHRELTLRNKKSSDDTPF